jgi:hypothetical protein
MKGYLSEKQRVRRRTSALGGRPRRSLPRPSAKMAARRLARWPLARLARCLRGCHGAARRLYGCSVAQHPRRAARGGCDRGGRAAPPPMPLRSGRTQRRLEAAHDRRRPELPPRPARVSRRAQRCAGRPADGIRFVLRLRTQFEPRSSGTRSRSLPRFNNRDGCAAVTVLRERRRTESPALSEGVESQSRSLMDK